MYSNNNYQDTSTMFGHGRLIEFTSEHLHHLFATINQTTPKPSVHVRDEVINYFLTDYRHAKQCYEIMTAAIESFDRVYKIRPKEDADIQFLQENLYAWEQKAPKLAGELFNINQKHVLKSRQPNGDLNLAGIQSYGEQLDIAYKRNQKDEYYEIASMLRTIFPPEDVARKYINNLKMEICSSLGD